jgi:hypothetical protein
MRDVPSRISQYKLCAGKGGQATRDPLALATDQVASWLEKLVSGMCQNLPTSGSQTLDSEWTPKSSDVDTFFRLRDQIGGWLRRLGLKRYEMTFPREPDR